MCDPGPSGLVIRQSFPWIGAGGDADRSSPRCSRPTSLGHQAREQGPQGTADEGAVAARAALIRGKLDAAAINVHVPTLIVRGAKSDLVTPDAVRALQAIIPGSEYVDVAEAGHMVAGDDNDTFTAAVLDFLHRIGTG